MCKYISNVQELVDSVMVCKEGSRVKRRRAYLFVFANV